MLSPSILPVSEFEAAFGLKPNTNSPRRKLIPSEPVLSEIKLDENNDKPMKTLQTAQAETLEKISSMNKNLSTFNNNHGEDIIKEYEKLFEKYTKTIITMKNDVSEIFARVRCVEICSCTC